MSNRNFAALPRYVQKKWGYCRAEKGRLKAETSSAMRAATRQVLDDIRQGGDPDGAVLPTHSRDVSDRWSYS